MTISNEWWYDLQINYSMNITKRFNIQSNLINYQKQVTFPNVSIVSILNLTKEKKYATNNQKITLGQDFKTKYSVKTKRHK